MQCQVAALSTELPLFTNAFNLKCRGETGSLGFLFLSYLRARRSIASQVLTPMLYVRQEFVVVVYLFQ